MRAVTPIDRVCYEDTDIVPVMIGVGICFLGMIGSGQTGRLTVCGRTKQTSHYQAWASCEQSQEGSPIEQCYSCHFQPAVLVPVLPVLLLLRGSGGGGPHAH
jgi:hypothetical protein